MTNAGITQLIKHPPVLDASDSIRRAAGVIRASDGTRVLVLREGRIAGSISEQSIASFLAATPNPNGALNGSIEPLVEYYPIFINASVTAQEAARVFAENNIDMLPVVDEHGGLRGVLYRGDVVAYLTQSLRPPTVGGMATPLGVYLTTGSITGGAGSFGLYLTGISLGLMMIVGKLAGDGVSKALSHVLRSHPQLYSIDSAVPVIISVLLLLLLLKFSPLAGYHGAEHMTVHAIEAGEELTPSIVRRMPRVHPRCGTNILAAAMIFTLITSESSSDIAVLVAMIVVVVGWRRIGGLAQSLFTTKPPTERQLKSGIAAGEEILKRYNEEPNYQAYGFKRIWNMGFLQAAAGMSTVLSAVYAIGALCGCRIL